jgi:hypothetical protein
VAIHCSHCGATLRRDDARFCSRCGSFVRSDSPSSKRGEVPFTPIMRQGRTRKAALREQIASQPTSRLAQHDENAELVSHAKSTTGFNVEKSVEASNSLGEASSGDVGDEASDGEALGEDAEEKASEVEEFSFSLVASQAESEPLIEVSDQAETLLSESTGEVSSSEKEQEQPLQSVDDDTLPLPFVGDGTLTPQPAAISSPLRKLRSRPILWLAVFLAALIIGGVICWLIILQSPNTNPWQRFSDTNLGFSVLYPTDWQARIDHKSSIVHFYDSTQTDKVDIAVSNATTSQVAQFLQQQASQLGMTNVTTEPSRSFAGSSWQQVQGKLSQEGVSYSVTLLATIHGNRLYLLTQRSPQSTYNDEEALIFSAMRAGWRFL